MFRITYSYSKVDSNYKLIGSPIIKYVDGETVKQVNDAFSFIRNNHDSTTCIGFIKNENFKKNKNKFCVFILKICLFYLIFSLFLAYFV